MTISFLHQRIEQSTVQVFRAAVPSPSRLPQVASFLLSHSEIFEIFKFEMEDFKASRKSIIVIAASEKISYCLSMSYLNAKIVVLNLVDVWLRV